MELNALLADGSRALGVVGHCLLRSIVVFVTELSSHCLLTACTPGEGMRRETPGRDSERLLALWAGHAFKVGPLQAGCLVTEGQGV